MLLLMLVGIISIILGIVFLSGYKPAKAVDDKLSKFLNKVIINLDTFMLKNRIGTGLCLLFIGAFCFFIAYWMKVMVVDKGIKIF